jgi:SAM-dependent methyltransferase
MPSGVLSGERKARRNGARLLHFLPAVETKSPAYELTQCIACGSNESREIADSDAMRREVELLWEFHGRRLRPTTPPERLMDRVAFSEHPPFRLVECERCGLVYRNPIERAYELDSIYADATPSPELLQGLHDTQLPAYRGQAKRLLHTLGRRGSGLEIGSYVGAFLAAAREVGLHFEGVDVNADVNAFTRSLGFTVHDGDLESLVMRHELDAVAIWNTFDQLPDPRGTANAAWRLLRPGGVFVVRVPNGEFYAALRRTIARPITGRLARLALAHNNLLTFPYRYGFTISSLTRLLERVGFRVQHVVGDVLVPIADEWTHRWASAEERVVKLALGVAARRVPKWAPWIEVYAVR